MLKNKRKESGAALLMALLIVAIVATIAGGLLAREHFTINRTISLSADAQMQSAATAAQAWAEKQLQAKQIKQKWPLIMPTLKLGGMTVDAKLIDLQGRFNLNNLVGGKQQAYFSKLVEAVDDNMQPASAQKLAKAISAWESPAGRLTAFDQLYAKSHPPYRAAHQMMVSVSELRLIAGVDATLYQSISPYLAALPKKSLPVNINTASPFVLLTIASNMDESTAQQIVQQAQSKPFVSIADFEKFSPVKQLKIVAQLTVQSEYVMLITRVTLGSQQLYLRTLLQRQPSHDSVITKPLWQVRSLA